VLVSNIAAPAAAYYRINSIQLPWTPEELERLAKTHQFTALYLGWQYFLSDEWRALLSSPGHLTQFQISMGLPPARMYINEHGNIIGWLWVRSKNSATVS